MRNSCITVLALVALSLTAEAHSETQKTPTSADTIEARWDVRDIEFTYSGITTAYSCSAVANKIRKIVMAVGGHPTTTVRATGCQGDRPARTLFIRVTTAVPQPVSEPQSSAATEREKLLARLGVRKEFQGEFPARRQKLSLANESQLRLAAGDCELMTELRDQVFPKLDVTVTAEDLNCIPRQLSIGTARLDVLALLPSDASAADRSPSNKP